ncbi:hypothetical protein DFH09DRAFT_83663 [Mycena vulgaris]|nr:hypothetical protein DFH09DRAFT_83663 [Mycena vulgaris]
MKLALQLYKGCTSFVVPIDPASPHPARLLNSEVPPHLALCTTSGKIMKAWGRTPAKECAPFRASVIERAKATIHHDRPPLSIWELDLRKSTHRTWSWMGYVPPNLSLMPPTRHSSKWRRKKPQSPSANCPAAKTWTGRPGARPLATSPSAAFFPLSSSSRIPPPPPSECFPRRMATTTRMMTSTTLSARTVTSQASKMIPRSSQKRALRAETTRWIASG